jgi:hypothetical protein
MSGRGRKQTQGILSYSPSFVFKLAMALLRFASKGDTPCSGLVHSRAHHCEIGEHSPRSALQDYRLAL